MFWIDIGTVTIFLVILIYLNKYNKKFENEVADNIKPENLRYSKDDYITTINDIGKYIECEDFNSLKNFYNKSMCEYKEFNQSQLLNPETINESAIYNIVCSKFYLAKKENIKVELEIKMNFTKINIKPYELAKILGILLDNAIEATRKCEEKNIFLSFLADKNKDIVKISNTYDNTKQIDINKIFIKGYSTKQKNTGLGLWEIKQILLKHNNLDLYTNKEGNLFVQELSIYRK